MPRRMTVGSGARDMRRSKRCTKSEAKKEAHELADKYGRDKCATYKELADMFPMDDEQDGEPDIFDLYDNVKEDADEEDAAEASTSQDAGQASGEDAAETSTSSSQGGASKPKKTKGKKVKWPKLQDKVEKERQAIMEEAKRLGDSRTEPDPRHIIIIYNPVSGNG
ncbi:hypothetical protein PTSG_13211, partial [Salpingoeca rosetta]